MRVVAIALAAGALLIGTTAVAASGDASRPTAIADATMVNVGQSVSLTGAGWGSDLQSVVEVVVCGNDALDGTLDCDVADTAAGGIRPGGTFFTAIVVHDPPMPCPCVFRLTSAGLATVVTIPVAIAGLPTVPPRLHFTVRRSVRLRYVRVVHCPGWRGLFGATPSCTVVYAIVNDGNVVLDDPPIDVVWGKGQHPSGFVQAPPAGELQVGEVKSFAVHVPLPAMSIGTYHVVVSANPLGAGSATQTVDAVLRPWGLLILCSLLVLAIAVRVGAGVGRIRSARRVAAGWYEDPFDDRMLRLWEGSTWSGRIRERPAMPPQAGWYRDPLRPDRLRLWDGWIWTEGTLDAGGVPDVDYSHSA